MKAKKTLTLILCVVLVMALSTAGTLAYFTSQDAAVNTFSVGSVEIDLTESKVDEDGKVIAGAEPVRANRYHLLPGRTYVKDPAVTVLAPSSECYVRMMVTVELNNELDDAALALALGDIFTGYDKDTWPRENKTVTADKKSISYEYRYFETVNAEEGDEELPALFTGFTVPGEWNNEELAKLQGMKINVEAHAIQAFGFDDADAAWIAFGQQYP